MDVNSLDQVPCPLAVACEALSVWFGMLHVHFPETTHSDSKTVASLHLLGKGLVLREALLCI